MGNLNSHSILSLPQKQYSQKKYDLAIEECKKNLSLGQFKLELNLIIAFSYIRMEEYIKADVHINKCLEIEPFHTHALLGSAFVDLNKNKESSAIFKYTRLINLKREFRKTGKILDALKSYNSTSGLLSDKPVSFFIPDKSGVARSHWTAKYQEGRLGGQKADSEN